MILSLTVPKLNTLLIFGLFPIFLLSFVSKWYLQAGFRIPYYAILVVPWCLLASAKLPIKKINLPKDLRLLLLLQWLYIIGIALCLPTLIYNNDPQAWPQFSKGFIMATFNAIITSTIIIFLAQLNSKDQRLVLQLYFYAIIAHMLYIAAQAIGIYIFQTDLDILISKHIPLWSGTIVSMSEDKFYLAALGTIYRLSGFTGDPNIAGVSMALSLPLTFYFYRQKARFWMVLQILLILLITLATVSNTAIPVSAVLLIALSARSWKRRKLLVAGIAVPVYCEY